MAIKIAIIEARRGLQPRRLRFVPPPDFSQIMAIKGHDSAGVSHIRPICMASALRPRAKQMMVYA